MSARRWTRRLHLARRVIAALTVIGLAISCRDDGPTALLKRPGAPARALAPTPNVEFYIHGSVEDWPIFMGNVAVASVQSGRKVVFMIATAGDGGQPAKYWQTREAGGLASIDSIIGAGAWSCGTQTVSAHPIRRCAKSTVVVYFMRMPDGNYYDGTGYGYGSLSNLRDLGTPTQPIDNSTTYKTWADFTNTLQAIVVLESQGQPAASVEVSAPDYDRTINPGDHPDNAATADAMHAATQAMGWTLAFYVDYQTENMPVNLSQADHDTKQRIFLAYDRVMVANHYSSDANDPDITQWLWRTYYRVSSPTPPGAPTSLAATTNSKSRIDLQWVDNASTETGFYVERAPDVGGSAGTFAQIGNVAANATTYSDLAVAPGTKYWYRVRAYNDGGTSAYSNSASATTLTSLPLPYRGDAYIMAHADDWQIFAGDHAYASFQSAASMLFIYTTAGDGGNPAAYWKQREKGAMASMDAVIGAGTWACASKTIRTHPIMRCTKNTTTVYFMRMPDGNYIDGTGYGYGSLSNLRSGTPTAAIDGSTTYNTWSDFYNTVGAIVDLEFDGQSSPYVKVKAQEYDKTLDPNDHPDHNTTGDAVRTVALTHVWDLEYFVGYDTENRNVNITDTQHSQKMLVWTAYDNVMVAGGYPSDVTDPEYQSWVWRTYFRTLLGTTTTVNPPSGLTPTVVSSSEIDLTWTDNSTNESGFSVERAPDNGGTPGTYAVIATVGSNVTSYANTGLTASTTYWYRVQALNANGNSTYSNAVSAATQPPPPPPPPAAPSNLAATAASPTQINLAWTDNATNESGFHIERAPDAGGFPGTYAEIASVGSNVTSYSNTGLTSGTTYWYRVRAYNTGGTSAYSNESSATTPLVKPLAPTGLAQTGATSTSITLGWTDNATNETGYLVERAPDNAGAPGIFAQVASIAANSITWTDTALPSSTTFWYRVRAAGPVNSDYSNVASAATSAPATPPNAPSNLVPTPVSTSEIDLTWTDNSIDETSFTLQRAPDAGGVPGTYATIATLGANVTSYKNTGLTASTTYWYQVRADNANGSSAWVGAKATTLTTAPTPPAAPTSLTAKPTTSALTANLAWKDNATNETNYLVERAPDNNGVAGTYAQIAVLGANVTTYTASGLTGFTKYWFRVRATNAAGNSSYSNAASVLTALPTDLTVDSLTVNGLPTADVEWYAGSGAKVDVYRNGVKIQSGLTNNGSWYDIGLTLGQTYVYQICNVGFTGASQCSNTWSVSF